MSDLDRKIQQARKLAQSPEAQQLAALLQQLGNTNMQQAMDAAAAGNMAPAREVLNALMQDPEARRLLQKLGGENG